MNADKVSLLAGRKSSDVAKAPRCSDRIARLYRSKEGLLDAAVGARKEVHDRRAVVDALVQERLGKGSAMGLGCERYLRDAMYRWLLGAGRSADTWTTYLKTVWKWITATGKRSLSAQIDTTPDEILGFLFAIEGADAAPRTVALHRDVLRSWFTWLVDRGLLDRSPVRKEATRAFRVDHGSVVKANGSRQVLTPEEGQRIATWALTVAEPIVGFSVMLELVGGLRSFEIPLLERRHLVVAENPEHPSTLTVPGKGKKTRIVPVEAILLVAWYRYEKASRRQGDRGLLLRRPGGGPYNRRTVQAWAKRAAAVVGRTAEISSHDFRASCSTFLRERGAEQSQVQALLGHASPIQTERCYVRRQKPMTATTGLTAPEIQ